jgi:predicted RNA binding protein YcfA (HicA-like mRNA interferase family)
MTRTHRSAVSRQLVREAEAMGYTAERTATGHWRFKHSATRAMVIAASDPSPQAMRNDLARLRRMSRV